MRSNDELFTDVEPNINAEFERKQDYFNSQIKKVINVERYIELEIERCYEQRYAEVPRIHASFEGASLREYFNTGWDFAERGLGGEIPRNLSLWGKDALAKIEAKYNEKTVPPDVYSRLNKHAIDEFISGSAWAKFYHWLIVKQKQGNVIQPVQRRNKIQEHERFESFDELFEREELVEDCIQLLRDAKAVDDGYKFVGRLKGVVVVWLIALHNKGFFKASIRLDKTVIDLLQKKLKGLTIEESSLRKENTRANNEYKKDFERELSYIKAK
jgi:hypothetical protein